MRKNFVSKKIFYSTYCAKIKWRYCKNRDRIWDIISKIISVIIGDF